MGVVSAVLPIEIPISGHPKKCSFVLQRRTDNLGLDKARADQEVEAMSTHIDKAIKRYSRERDRYTKLADIVFEKCRGIVSRSGVRATVQRRTKDPESLQRKLRAWHVDEKKRARVADEDAIFRSIGDLAGVRITTYLESDRDIIVKELTEDFAGPNGDDSPIIDKKDGNAKGRFYRATHCQVVVPVEDLEERDSNIASESCEVQVCSLLAHVWNEIEHDLRYKPMNGSLGKVEERLLDQLGQLTMAGDLSIQTLLEATEDRLAKMQGDFADVHDFVARMRPFFPGATLFALHADQLFEEVSTLGLNSPDSLDRELVLNDKPEERAVKILDELQGEVGSSATIDPRSSDVLLALLQKKRAQEIVDAHPTGRGRGRPTRLVLLARRYASV